MKTKPLACWLLALALPALAPAQGNLILPRSQDEFRKLMQPDNAGPCDKCGVVTNVRAENRPPESRPSAHPTDSGIGGNIATTPIFGSGSVVRDARNANKPTTYYKMTVRFDDGTYAFFEDDDEPEVHQGDRVKIVDGQVVHISD